MSPPLPAPVPFSRLQINDGLLMTAALWEQAHEYHRQRQNFLYQALFQPGIVWGLGVAVTEAPETVEAIYRDRRWVQVQPGVAVDRLGNPIVVPGPEVFRIQSEPPGGKPQVVFLVLRYSDPRDRAPTSAGGDMETFALIETTAPEPNDVELCRVKLTGGGAPLAPTGDVFAPGLNQLDLRHRLQAQGRPQRTLQGVEVLGDRAQTPVLTSLPQWVPGIYPPLAPVAALEITVAELGEADFAPWDWLYLPGAIARTLPPLALAKLETYLAQGGCVMVALDSAGTPLPELYALVAELEEALGTAERENTPVELRRSLEQECQSVKVNLGQQINRLVQTLGSFAGAVGHPLHGEGRIGPDHALRRHPFWFGAWPQAADHPLEIRAWGGLVVVVGAIATAWDLAANLDCPRHHLRSLHELTVNLLQFGSDRRHLGRLQTPVPIARSPATRTLRRTNPQDMLKDL